MSRGGPWTFERRPTAGAKIRGGASHVEADAALGALLGVSEGALVPGKVSRGAVREHQDKFSDAAAVKKASARRGRRSARVEAVSLGLGARRGLEVAGVAALSRPRIRHGQVRPARHAHGR